MLLQQSGNGVFFSSMIIFQRDDSQVFQKDKSGLWASLVAKTVKNPPAVQETWVRSLGLEDALEEDMEIHSSILAWRIPMDREVWQATIHRVQRVGCD